MNRHFFSVKKLNEGPGHLRVAARHNLRELQAELGASSHIDASRIADNVILAGPKTAGEVVVLADGLLMEAGAKVKRKDAVRAVELLFSLPPETSIDVDAFFSDAVEWVRGFFSVPLLSAVIHKDEAAPHCHVLLLPLVDGRMAGSDLVGNRARLRSMQTAFYESVGMRYGLVRPKAVKRQNAATMRKAAELAFTAIVSDPDLLIRPTVEVAVIDAFRRDPEPLLGAIGISMPIQGKPLKSFVAIMTKPCKPESRIWKPNTIGFESESKPIGFANIKRQENEPYVSVGFRSSDEVCIASKVVPPPPPPPLPDAATKFQRVSDDQPAAYWDADLGEFRDPTKAKGNELCLL